MVHFMFFCTDPIIGYESTIKTIKKERCIWVPVHAVKYKKLCRDNSGQYSSNFKIILVMCKQRIANIVHSETLNWKLGDNLCTNQFTEKNDVNWSWIFILCNTGDSQV